MRILIMRQYVKLTFRTSRTPINYLIIPIQYILKIMQITFHRGIAKQATKISTSSVNVCPEVNFTHVMRVYFVMVHVLNVVWLDTSNQFVKLLYIISLRVILNSVIHVQLVRAILMIIYYPYLQLQIVLFILKNWWRSRNF